MSKTTSTLIAIMIASGAAMPASAQNNNSAIFREVTGNVSLTERQRAFLGVAGASSATTGLKIVDTVPFSTLHSILTEDASKPTAHSKISLRVSDNVVLTASRIDVVEKSDSGIWRGTVEESGGPLVEAAVWTGLFAPAGTPAAIVSKLNAAIKTALESPDVISYMRSNGYESAWSSQESFRKDIETELAQWAEVIRLANVPLQ